MFDNFHESALRLLGGAWTGRTQFAPLLPDGSLRRFCRLSREDGARAVAAAPPPGDAAGLREAQAGWKIGRHLFASGAPVPEPLAFDEASGLLICEDLGDVRLHDVVLKHGADSAEAVALYQQAVAELAKMQVRGRAGFDPAWCWDTPRYDRRIMLERESGYFLRALCRDLLHLDIDEAALNREFAQLADQAAQADASFFLHRDFQSRNIMVLDGQVRFIDYQAGRLGPLAYDLASLLIDPYAALPQAMQDALLEHYLDALNALLPYSREQFRREYLLLAVQRNLQILGAFAFLSSQRGRPFFAQYIPPALFSLHNLFAQFQKTEYVFLKSTVQHCLNKFTCQN
ncbi:aminoglycoside phosphotransferase family protein [Candidatus Electronema sp. JM]|uniref:aminoglycoside phosphotransferase family protein n=1 Tax=Candidatus Electronema sp. JM TaxID=3401571 RepID=UPI003AA89F54